MVLYKLALSNDAPSGRDTIWLKPAGNGFAMYMLEGGTWKPLQLNDDNSISQTGDDTVINVKNKADKVSSATNGHLAGLNSKGNLTDSGYAPSDFATPASVEDAIAAATLNPLTYKGVINDDSDLPDNLGSNDNGAAYIVGTAGTYADESLNVGDYVIWSGTAFEVLKYPTT